jgi:arylsulfatase A-like enzyme
LIIRAPNVGKGVRTASLTELLDVYPTLCDLVGLPKPTHLQGKSLVPILHNPKTQIHEAAISQCSTVDSQMSPQLVGGQLDELTTIKSQMGWTLRTPRFRYVEWREAKLTDNKQVFGTKVLGVELYDYQTDPLEHENLAGKTEFAAVLKEQQALFDKLLPHLPKRER